MKLSPSGWSVRTLLTPMLAPLLLTGVAACGGGGGSSSTNDPIGGAPAAPVSTFVTSEGVITGFGSVYVNDLRYQLDRDTRVVADDDERLGDDSVLQLGMKVSIRARERDGERIADSIRHRRDLKGPVTQLMLDAENPGIGTFFVANTRVIVDAHTVFARRIGDTDGNGTIDIRDLSVASGRLVVAVSGFASDDGYLATRITRVSGDDDDELEIKGFVTAVDTDASTFVVSGTEFMVTGATEFDDGLSFGPELEGVFVEVEARRVAGGYEAREVEREDDDDDDRRGRFEIEGILISVDTESTPNLVQIGGRSIQVRDASSLTRLVGSRVQIKGTFDDAGVLVLHATRLRDDQRVATEDRVVSVDTADGSFTTRLGLVIRPEGLSRLEDDDDDAQRLTPEQFLNRLRSNDYIEARGSINDDGSITWTRIKREDDDDDDDDDDEGCELRGPVQDIAEDRQSITILGVTIDVASGRDVEFEDGDYDISRNEFFNRLSIGDIVEAESDDDDFNACQNGFMLAEEVEIRRRGVPFVPPVNGDDNGDAGDGANGVVFLLIDEDSIDNGNPPNHFSDVDVNDQIAAIGQRQPLEWFQGNIGSEIDLFTGQVGDEGWFALKTILKSWQDAGPTGNGTRNFLQAGPGLGGPPDGDNREVLLDEIPDVTPLRATGLAMLTGQTICAVVYDSDISINYDPLQGNLQGDNLGVVSFDVLGVTRRTDGSSSDLPRVRIRVRDAATCEQPLVLFDNAPVPMSSSEPEDIEPPVEPPAPLLVPAV